MSRIAKNPILIPSNIIVVQEEGCIKISGNGSITEYKISDLVEIKIIDNSIKFYWDENNKFAGALAGTTSSNIRNIIDGITKLFEIKLLLVGVGYRAQAKDSLLVLSLGFSHPIEYIVPKQISVETPTQTEIHLKGSDKQLLGQIAAEIRQFRPPEPYKGKGIKYSNEFILRKDAKKK